jgi:microcystin-dependent protein
MGYSSVIGSTLTTTLLQVNTVLTGSIMNMTTIQTSSIQGSTLTMNSMTVLSTLSGSTINATNLIISSISGSTIGFNTVSIYSTITVSSLTGSTLAGSTMNMTAIGFSTIAGSTMLSNVLVVQSTMFGSTLTATNMNYSTLRGDNIQSQSMMVSTLTGSTINFINLAYSTLAVSTVTANVAFPLLVTGSTITTNTIGITSLMTVETGGRVGVGTTAPSYPLTISNATFKGLEMNTCCSTVSGSVSSFTTGAVYSVTHPTSGFRAEYAYVYGGASTLASAVQTGANGYYVIDVAGSAGSSGIFASDTVGPEAASFYMNATKAVFQTGVVGVGITNPQWPITVGLDLAAGSAVSNPLSAQLVLRGKTNTGSLKIGSFYTSGSGVGVIQSSDISTGFDSVLPLSLNPLGGNVGIGLTNAPHTFVPFSNITLPAITAGVIWPAQMAVAGNPSAQLLLKMGSYYTGGVGSYCAIQSTETYFNVEHPQPLALQPIGGNVGIGITNPNTSLYILNPIAQAGNTTMITTQIMARPATASIQNNMSGGFAIGAASTAAASVGRLDIMVSGVGSAGNRFGLTPDIPVASFLGSGDVMIPNRECIVTQINGHGQFRAIAGNYGFMIRNDGVNTNFLLTASGNQYGTFNGLRPLAINNVSGLVTVSNGLTVSGAFTCNSINIIPTGIIVMWYGSVSNIPSGWYLCNGANGTPNLLDRFIVGAGNLYPTGGVNIGNEYNGTGGLKDVALSVSQMPSHSHTASDSGHNHGYYTFTEWNGNNADGGDDISARDNPSIVNRTTNIGYANITVQATGGGAAHENRPPYYALCYIMKA